MTHFFVTVSVSKGEQRASTRVGPFSSVWSLETWVNDFRRHATAANLRWQPEDIEETEGSPDPSSEAVLKDLNAQLASAKLAIAR